MANTFELIASSTVGAGGASSITFSSIPSTYTDLVVKLNARQSLSGNDSLGIKFNSLTTGNSSRWLYGNGAGTGSGTDSSTVLVLGYSTLPGTSATASTFNSTDIYIPNYAGSNQKSVSGDSVGENNGTTAFASLSAALQTLTSAITSISLLPYSGGNFVQYSTAYLFGIKSS